MSPHWRIYHSGDDEFKAVLVRDGGVIYGQIECSMAHDEVYATAYTDDGLREFRPLIARHAIAWIESLVKMSGAGARDVLRHPAFYSPYSARSAFTIARAAA